MQNIWEKFSVYVVTVLTGSFSLQVFLPPRNFSSHVVFGWADIKGLTPDDHPWISCFSGLEFIWSAQVPRAQGSTQTTCCIYRWSQRKVPGRLESCSAHLCVCHWHTHTHHYRSGAAVTVPAIRRYTSQMQRGGVTDPSRAMCHGRCSSAHMATATKRVCSGGCFQFVVWMMWKWEIKK